MYFIYIAQPTFFLQHCSVPIPMRTYALLIYALPVILIP